MVENPSVGAGDAKDLGSIPGSGRFLGEGNGNPLQYFCLGNPINRRAWQAAVHGVAKSQTQLNTAHTSFIPEGQFKAFHSNWIGLN